MRCAITTDVANLVRGMYNNPNIVLTLPEKNK